MKKTLALAILLLVSSLNLQATKPEVEKELFGKWKLVKSATNGKPNPSIINDRTWEFFTWNAFLGIVNLPEGPRPYNHGMFLLANDTTMITFHTDNLGKLSKVSYTYNFHIRTDSLHLYGFYFRGVPSEPGMLQMMYIDEWWVKLPVLSQK